MQTEQNLAVTCAATDPELYWMIFTSTRVCRVLDILSGGGYLVQRFERSHPQYPKSKRTKTVTRLFDKDGKQLEGVHNYARMRLMRCARLEVFCHGKGISVFVLKKEKDTQTLA
jgi:hypothetical protein